MALAVATVVGLALLCLGFFWGWRLRPPQAHHAAEGSPSSAPPPRSVRTIWTRPPAPDLTPVKSCPVCLREFAPRNRFCPNDGAELLDGPAAGPFSQGMICPTCRRGYSHDAGFCPDDADELVPYGMYGASNVGLPPVDFDSRKICPECGELHTSSHLFCGQDGAELVVLN